MEKLSLKERVNLYKRITEAKKEFFKKLREHDLGEVAIQDIQMKALEPVTGKIEEVKKQAQEIYTEIQEYFRLNRMDQERSEMKKIYEEINNVNEKLAFVKQVLEDIVNKVGDIDFEEAKDEAAKEAKEDVETRERRSMEKEDIAGKEDRERLSMSKEDKPDKVGDVKLKNEDDVEKQETTSTNTVKKQERFESLSIPVGNKGWIKINKEDVEDVTLTRLKTILNKRYPGLEKERIKNRLFAQYTKNNPNELRDLLVENLSREALVEYVRSLPPSPTKKSKKIITSTGERTSELTPTVVGKGIKRKRGRPKKTLQKGKGKKEHLVNSLVLHTGSKAAGNDNLDKDIKQIINRMHKNKMITASQKKELLKKYI